MSHWEGMGKSDEWYTPRYIFEAMGGPVFDFDVAHPKGITTNVLCDGYFYDGSIEKDWDNLGFIWMNPPFGGRNALVPWLNKFFDHGNGIALTPDRTSAPWYQNALLRCDLFLMIDGKVKFEKADGTTGDSPSTGTTLFANGQKGIDCLLTAQINGLGRAAKLTNKY